MHVLIRQMAVGSVGWLLLGNMVYALSLSQDDEQIRRALVIFNRAKHLHQEKHYDEAIREYRQAIKLDDQNPWIYNSMGLALTARGSFKDAIKAFRLAIKLSPDLTDVHNNLGVVYAEMGRREKAFEEFTLVIRDPNYPTPEKALYNLGNLYLQEKNYELALMHYRRTVERKPKFALGYRGLGKVHLALGEPEQAKEQFQTALEHFPDDIESLYELARLHEQQGDTESARDYYRRVVEVDRFSILGKLSLRRLDTLKPGT